MSDPNSPFYDPDEDEPRERPAPPAPPAAVPPIPVPMNQLALAECERKVREHTEELRALQRTIASNLAMIDQQRERERELKDVVASWQLLRSLMDAPAAARPCSFCVEPCRFCVPVRP